MKVKLDPGAYLPERAHKFDAGLDIRTPNDFWICAMDSQIIDTGIHVAVPDGCVGLIKSRSSLNARGLQCEGVIDAGYTGSIKVVLYNHTDKTVSLERGDKIAQLLVMPCVLDDCDPVDELEETDRGSNGFGSTGR